MIPEVFTINETAKKLKCSPHTIRRMIDGKELKAFKLIGVWRITDEAIKDFIKKQEERVS